MFSIYKPATHTTCALKHVCRHPDLEESLLNYFGDNTTPAHLKMADTPGDDTTRLIPCLADNGIVSPFPLVAVRNVFVLPGGCCQFALSPCVCVL
jgi:cell division FtsZ-interacting protein ZapD